MDLKLLDDLVALHEAGSFSKAARLRGVTQPAFSKRIRSLEGWVGTRLVDRHTHPVALTEAGRVFLERAREVTKVLHEARDEVLAAGAEPRKVIITAATTLSHAFVPTWITALRERMPGLRAQIRLNVGYPGHIEALHQRDVDYFLSYASPDTPKGDPAALIWRTVATSALFPVCAASEFGEPLYRLGPQHQAPAPYIARTGGSFLGGILRKAQAKWHLELDEVFEVATTINVKAMVREGVGVAWLTSESVKKELASGELVRASPEFEIPLEIRLYRLNTRLNERAEELWRLL